MALSSLEIENGWPAHIVGELKLAALQVAPFIPNGRSNSLVPLGDYTVTFGEAPARSVAPLRGWPIRSCLAPLFRS